MALVDKLCPVVTLLTLVRSLGPNRELHLDQARAERDWIDCMSLLQSGFSVRVANHAITIETARGVVIGRVELADVPSDLLPVLRIITAWAVTGNGHLLEALIGATRGSFRVERDAAAEVQRLVSLNTCREAAAFLTPPKVGVEVPDVSATGIRVRHLVSSVSAVG